jgi:malate dehydrogenase (oxaloacetate-decarboxylating)
MPVMEGKAQLFKEFAGIDGFPICLNVNSTEELIETVSRLEPTFGGINLEDIAAPRCFEVEEALRSRLDIPVFHDDQHGTAVVILAGLLNAAKVVKKELKDLRVVVAGIGAAGTATTELLIHAGVIDIVGYDRMGPLTSTRSYEGHPAWEAYAKKTNPFHREGSLGDILRGADAFIGVSSGNLLSVQDVEGMAKDPILFVMANPEPEIRPELVQSKVRVLATGRSDYPNQINNVLCFPGLFRGVLDSRASRITIRMKIAAAQALAQVVKPDELSAEYIIPSVFNREVSIKIAQAVTHAAEEEGVARRISTTLR